MLANRLPGGWGVSDKTVYEEDDVDVDALDEPLEAAGFGAAARSPHATAHAPTTDKARIAILFRVMGFISLT